MTETKAVNKTKTCTICNNRYERYRPPCDTECAVFDDSLRRTLCLLRARVDS